MNCENSLKVVTGSRSVSPLVMVRKSNIPALSRKVLSLVRCLLLRKFVGFVLKQVLPPQKCSMLRVGRVFSDLWWTWVWDPFYRIPSFHKWQMGGRRSFGRKFRFPLVDFPPSTVRCRR